MSDNKLNSDSEEAKNDKDRPENKGEDQGSDANSSNSNNTDNSDNTDNSESKEESSFGAKSNIDSQKVKDSTSQDKSNDENENSPDENADFKEKSEIGIPESDSIKDNTDTDIKPEDRSTDANAEITPAAGSGIKPLSTVNIPKENNYQISLINEDLLKILVSANKKSVKIDSVVIDSDTSVQSQTNEINIYPKLDLSFQEAEVLIEILNDEVTTESKEIKSIDSDIVNETYQKSGKESTEETAPEVKPQKSNYQINLINENLLKIRIITFESVRIESVSRDKKNSIQSQNNKIFIKQKPDSSSREIEITIALEEYSKEAMYSGLETTEDGKVKLIPNPEVVDLIQPPDYSSLYNEEFVEENLPYKNPFDNLRELVRKNLTIGLIIAVTLHLAVAGIVFFKLSGETDKAGIEEPQRLIILQDLPDPKIKLENVEDPNKPKVEEIPLPPDNQDPKREVTPRRVVKPPTITRPKREETKLDSNVDANLTRSLDSLRQLREGGLNDSSLALADSILNSRDSTFYEIPDSLRNAFNEQDIGLIMNYPNNWKITDQREINKNEKEFKGVVLTDTTAEQPGTMSMFIYLDNDGKDYNAEDFATEFEMLDTNLTAFSKEPKTLAGFTEYRFYIFNDTGIEKLSLRASVRKQFFDKYKQEIEAVVRSISIKKKDDLNEQGQDGEGDSDGKTIDELIDK
jgi:hypothetical protein